MTLHRSSIFSKPSLWARPKTLALVLLGLIILPLTACSSPAPKQEVNAASESVTSEPVSESAPEQDENQLVQAAMKTYVQTLIADTGLMPVLHEGKILQLKLNPTEKYPEAFHDGVSKQGNLFASCADFIDPVTQDQYDIDFLVSKVGGTPVVVQPLVHSKNGEKVPYDLEH